MASSGSVTLRTATAEDAESIASIWHQGWQDGHLGNVPNELTAARTERSFFSRAGERVPDTTVAEADGQIAGFVMVVEDEVEQLYVDEKFRGSGVAVFCLPKPSNGSAPRTTAPHG
jgi:L-amino acid N-acyltransferase YncA